MTANQAFENVLCQVQSSCLNFKIEISPFSATIFLKKSFIKNQHGVYLRPPQEPASEENCDDLKGKITELSIENKSLQDKYESATREMLTCNEIIDNLKNEIKQKQEIIEALDLANKGLENESKVIRSELYNTRVELTKHSEKENKISEKHADVKTENQTLKNQVEELTKKLYTAQMNNKVMEEKELKIEKLEMKVDELEMKNKSKSIDVIKLDEKISDLENENTKLKDVLYGCCECGLFICECSDAIANDSSCSPPTSQPSPPSVSSYETRAPQHLPSPRSGSYSWTPPPTPPCEGCGGINYGPSPA